MKNLNRNKRTNNKKKKIRKRKINFNQYNLVMNNSTNSLNNK